MTSALKTAICSVILMAAVILALAVPWYPVTTSQRVPQIQAYTTNITGSFAMTSTGTTVGNLTQINYYLPLGQSQTVYTLPSPVTFSSQYANWTSPSFYLQSGMAFRLTVSLCEDCFIAMMPQNGTVNGSLTYDFNTNPPQLGMNNYTVIGLVANSGNYVIFMHNSELKGTVTGLSVYEMTASLQTSTVTSQAMQVSTVLATVTSTGYSTSNSTAYLQSMTTPYAVLGLGPSAVIIVLVAIMAYFAFVVERGKRQKHG